MINIHDAIRDRENQVSSLQVRISVIQKEIEALRIAIRILEGDSVAAAEPVPAIPSHVSALAGNSSLGAEKSRVWP